ncbi:MAG: MBL fold metallo-hydrolase [Treponema sp.]
MKIYFNSSKKSINTYLLIEESSKDAILIDPCDISEYFIEKLENENISLKAVCITNSSIEETKRGLKTWQNIYDFPVFKQSNLFSNDIGFIKSFQISSFNIEAFCIKRNSKTFCMYKIENALFTGQSLFASIFQPSSINKVNTKHKLQNDRTQSFDEHIIMFPFSGPPTTLENFIKKHLNKPLSKVASIHSLV